MIDVGEVASEDVFDVVLDDDVELHDEVDEIWIWSVWNEVLSVADVVMERRRWGLEIV